MGTYKVRNEIETKQNQWKRNKTKQNEINKNETKQNEINEMKTKSTKTKRNRKLKKNNRGLKEIKPIFKITMLDYFPHMSQCLSSWEDRIWSSLNKNTMHLFSGSLSFWLGGFF